MRKKGGVKGEGTDVLSLPSLSLHTPVSHLAVAVAICVSEELVRFA